MSDGGLHTFLTTIRVEFDFSALTPTRRIKKTQLKNISDSGSKLVDFIADKAPMCYREPSKVVASISDGLFLTAITETLSRLPKSKEFRQSHFGEILARIFSEEVMGLVTLYSKLSLLTAENANAYKMDLVMYKPNADPFEFHFIEVKSSPKACTDSEAPNHHKSCYPSLFKSLRRYTGSDQNFDIAAIRDRLTDFPDAERARIRAATLPYSSAKVIFHGAVVLDASTFRDDEIALLATRKSKKAFDVDMVALGDYAGTCELVFTKLESIRSAACSS